MVKDENRYKKRKKRFNPDIRPEYLNLLGLEGVSKSHDTHPNTGPDLGSASIKQDPMSKQKDWQKEESKLKSKEEQALDEKATEGEKVNPQEQQKKNRHVPRDNA